MTFQSLPFFNVAVSQRASAAGATTIAFTVVSVDRERGRVDGGRRGLASVNSVMMLPVRDVLFRVTVVDSSKTRPPPSIQGTPVIAVNVYSGRVFERLSWGVLPMSSSHTPPP